MYVHVQYTKAKILGSPKKNSMYIHTYLDGRVSLFIYFNPKTKKKKQKKKNPWQILLVQILP